MTKIFEVSSIRKTDENEKWGGIKGGNTSIAWHFELSAYLGIACIFLIMWIQVSDHRMLSINFQCLPSFHIFCCSVITHCLDHKNLIFSIELRKKLSSKQTLGLRRDLNLCPWNILQDDVCKAAFEGLTNLRVNFLQSLWTFSDMKPRFCWLGSKLQLFLMHWSTVRITSSCLHDIALLILELPRKRFPNEMFLKYTCDFISLSWAALQPCFEVTTAQGEFVSLLVISTFSTLFPRVSFMKSINPFIDTLASSVCIAGSRCWCKTNAYTFKIIETLSKNLVIHIWTNAGCLPRAKLHNKPWEREARLAQD